MRSLREQTDLWSDTIEETNAIQESIVDSIFHGAPERQRPKYPTKCFNCDKSLTNKRVVKKHIYQKVKDRDCMEVTERAMMLPRASDMADLITLYCQEPGLDATRDGGNSKSAAQLYFGTTLRNIEVETHDFLQRSQTKYSLHEPSGSIDPSRSLWLDTSSSIHSHDKSV